MSITLSFELNTDLISRYLIGKFSPLSRELPQQIDVYVVISNIIDQIEGVNKEKSIILTQTDLDDIFALTLQVHLDMYLESIVPEIKNKNALALLD